MKTIGLLGGISWVSTMDYYRLINEGVNEKSGGLNFAKCVIYSLNFADIQEKTWEHASDLLFKGCDELLKTDVDAIALCANTAHLFADEISTRIGKPLIHIGTATANSIKESGIKKVGLLGTKFTMEKKFYIDKLAENEIEVFIPSKQETRNYMQETLKNELGKGIVHAKTREQYKIIAHELLEQGAEGIIFGCTEIPLLLSQDDFSVPVFDTTKIHAQAIVEFITA